MTYQYDLFVSYPSVGSIPSWVSNVLVPTVRDYLSDELGDSARIAFARELFSAGEPWPAALSEMHARSRAFLMVLAAAYFNSPWCASEWQHAVERARLCAAPSMPRIIVPIRFNDMENHRIPDEVQNDIRTFQHEDFGAYNCLGNPKDETADAHAFRKKVRDLCVKSLSRAIHEAPEFRDDWPRLPQVSWSKKDPRWKARL